MNKLDAQFQDIFDRVAAAAVRSGRSTDAVTIIAVSKKQPVSSIQSYIDFCADRGYRCVLGENYVQEWALKKPLLTGVYTAHAIGHLQSNKIKEAASLFESIQTIDSKKSIDVLAKLPRERPMPLWLQVNISSDDNKFGVAEDGIEALCATIQSCPALKLVGLMTITKAYDHPEDARPDFKKLHQISLSVSRDICHGEPLLLSMGMSDDFEIAIEEGATHVRIGSALFGARQNS
jgi:pyridoxal phosphate enzyme (YggS family)